MVDYGPVAPLPWTAATSTTETWDAFFSDFYLRAYADDERDAEAETQALAAVRLAGCEPGADVLDVPCGFGRHTIALARAGYRVVGVDRSAALLDEARRRAGGERWPKLARADYRELPFADDSFDAALNLFTSLGYLGDEEDTKVLAAIRRVLRPGAQARARDDAPRPARRGLERQRLAADGRGAAAARAAHLRPGRRASRRRPRR